MDSTSEGKVIVITGTSRGIGLQVALALNNDGHTLALFDKKPIKDPVLKSQLRSNPGRIREWCIDVTDRNAIEDAVKEIISRWGRIDALINIAGEKLYTAYENILPEQFDSVIKTNINGPYYMCYAVIPIMKQQKYGKIINMASRSGMKFYAEGTAYCASKAGLIGFSQALAKALHGSGIAVNVLCPSAVATPELMQEEPEADFARMTKIHEIVDTIRVLLCLKNQRTGMIFPFYNLRSYVKGIIRTCVQFIKWIPQIKIGI